MRRGVKNLSAHLLFFSALLAVQCSITIASRLAAQTGSRPDHPLAPLTGDEIAAAVSLLKAECKASDLTRFTVITLDEPNKDGVLRFAPGQPVERRASVVAYEY